MKNCSILLKEVLKSPKRFLYRAFYEVPLLKETPLFDKEYYLNTYPDVARSEIDPLWHYILYGASEGRLPSRQFNSRAYLENNPDVKNSNINPLVHYIKYGKAEGRVIDEGNRVIIDDEIGKGLLDQIVSLRDPSAVLILDHNWGGGSNQYICSLFAKRLAKEDTALPIVILARYDLSSGCIKLLVILDDNELLSLPFFVDVDVFFDYMEKVELAEIIVNSLVTWPVSRTIEFLSNYKRKHTHVKVRYKGHDFFCVCPNYILLDASYHFCGVRSDEIECRDCIMTSEAGKASLNKEVNLKDFSMSQWRIMWGKFFESTVDSFDIFSESAKMIFLKAYSGIENIISLSPHEVDSFECCHVAVLGTLSEHKGKRIIEDLCGYLDALSIDNFIIHLYGGGVEIHSPRVRSYGSYHRYELPELLKKDKIDIVFIPSVWNETFCYTMAESLALGYLTACFDFGGQADQARASEHGILLDSQKPGYIYRTFMRIFNEKNGSAASLAGAAESFETEKPNTAANTVIIQDRFSREFLKWMYKQRDDKSHYIPETKDAIAADNRMPKIIAAYLPQFHDFPENVRWFGKGFSEWTNTSQTLPQFMGHRQPNVPVDVGFYHLDDTSIIHRQAELAKKYGIAGFCVYYYWFSGQKLMDKPLKKILEDKSLDFPFFLFWANDDWTRNWGDGAFREVLYKAEMNPQDADRFMADILPYMKDPRYIRIKNKPVLLLYKIQLFPKNDYLRFVDRIQKIARDNGFEGLYLLSPVEDYVDHDKFEDSITEYHLDAMMEFHPIAGRKGWQIKDEHFLDPNCHSTCYNVEDFINNRKYLLDTSANVFAGLFPNWDNSPRCYSRGAWILQSTPENYKKWLKDLIQWTYAHHKEDERYIFVNAWNEWAESAYLEPDVYHGYAYLQMTREALEEGLQQFLNNDPTNDQ